MRTRSFARSALVLLVSSLVLPSAHTTESSEAVAVDPCAVASTPALAILPPTLDVFSNGSDGALNFIPDVGSPNTMTIDLAQAYSGPGVTWQSISPVQGTGVYDAAKWAIVFHYTSVTVPAGKTIRFTNHPSNAPVVWLVAGSVTIAGTVDVSGEVIVMAFAHFMSPGPGGFRGGIGGGFGFDENRAASGFGPGGGRTAPMEGGAVGAYATQGSGGTALNIYGNARILPLIGGSGGAGRGGANNAHSAGGAGGGAILIAAGDSIVVSGQILAKAGTPGGSFRAGMGAGGAIRLIAPSVSGAGSLRATGGTGGLVFPTGGDGRIRIETLSGTVSSTPVASRSTPDSPVLLWPPSTGPRTTIVSIGNRNAPSDPTSLLDPGTADVSVLDIGMTTVRIDCDNVPVNALVTLLVKPKFGDTISTAATFQTGDATHSQWAALVDLPAGTVVLQVHATF